MLTCQDTVTTTTKPRKLPRGSRWTYADYCKIPPDRKRHEIIDGRHYVSAAPGVRHQWVSAHLLFELMRLISKRGVGTVYNAPIDVHLAPGTVVQPDLVVLTPRSTIVGIKKLTGVPDLLIEILSPSNAGHDRKRKHERYERAGVAEYWIVDPERNTIEQFVWRDGAYGEGKLVRDRIRLHVLPDVEIDLREVW
ncbi:MAG: Uma2 family endonuclease [Planctomycetes bacterium]|nr:Uma2 family endonuclease [Planctomycetota bacterium]